MSIAQYKASSKLMGERLEWPFLIRHVEGHLVFGPLSRHVPFGYVTLVCVVISIFMSIVAVHQPIAEYIGGIIDKLFFILIPLFLLCMTCRQQAIFGWVMLKGGLGVAALMAVFLGSRISFAKHQADAWPNLLLGLIWTPGIEFIPSITPYQKYVSIARVILSIPCIYFGVISGNWHW